MKILLIAAVAVFAQLTFAADTDEPRYPADNASEITPPHEARGYTYAKGDPLHRIIHGTDPDRVRRNEISAGEYGWEEYDRCASCGHRQKHEYACTNCEYRSEARCHDCGYERVEVRDREYHWR